MTQPDISTPRLRELLAKSVNAESDEVLDLLAIARPLAEEAIRLRAVAAGLLTGTPSGDDEKRPVKP
jgi:hypothetical protein